MHLVSVSDLLNMVLIQTATEYDSYFNFDLLQLWFSSQIICLYLYFSNIFDLIFLENFSFSIHMYCLFKCFVLISFFIIFQSLTILNLFDLLGNTHYSGNSFNIYSFYYLYFISI